jgi:WD40 repeat protein
VTPVPTRQLIPLGEPISGTTGAGLAYSPDGKILAAPGPDNTLRLWDVSAPQAPAPLGAPLQGHTDAVLSVAFSPADHLLASGGRDKTIRLWDLANPSAPVPLGAPLTRQTEAIFQVAFSPDGHTLASISGDETISLWDITDPSAPAPLGALLQFQPVVRNVVTLAGSPGTDEVRGVAFSPAGQLLAVGGCAEYTNMVDFSGCTLGEVRLWDVTDPGAPQSLASLTGQPTGVDSLTFRADGQVLVVNGSNHFYIWDVSQPQAPQLLSTSVGQHINGLGHISFSPDGKTLASGSCGQFETLPGCSGGICPAVCHAGEIIWWDASDPLAAQPLHAPFPAQTDWVTDLAFSPDGRTLASASLDGTLQLWEVPQP